MCEILSLSAMSGHGDSNSRNIPTLVKDISNVGEVSCGSSHTIALSKDGRTVWSFGGGDNGVCDPILGLMTRFLSHVQLRISVKNMLSCRKTRSRRH